MTTAYTSLLGLALPVTGELSGTWGDTVNNSITSLLDTSVAGTTNVSTDTDVTLTTTTGAANTARQAILLFSGARTALRTVVAPAQSKTYTVINATTGGFAVKLVGSGPTTGVTIIAGESAFCAWNGSDFVKVSNTGGAYTVTDLTVTGNTILGDANTDTATVNALGRFNALATFGYAGTTGSTLTTTAPAFVYSGATTYTDTSISGGTKAHGPFWALAAPTLANPTTATTYTNATTLYIAGAPVAGTNITITNPYSVYVAAGASYFGGAVSFAGSATLTTTTVTSLTDTGLTAGRVTYATTGGLLTDSANLTFDGTNLTLGGGTANGVTYLNGSKVLTSGSALVFDGSTLIQTGAVSTSSIIKLFNNNQSSSGFWLGQGWSSGTDNVAYLLNTANAGFVFATNNAEQMRLTSTGLGIGTSSPNAKLTVGDSSGAVLGIPTTASFYGTSSISSSIGTVGLFSTETAAANVGPILTFGGKSGNTYSPYPFAYIQGAKASATAGDYSGYLRFITTPSDGGSPVERLRLDSAGNLGLGVVPSDWSSASRPALQLTNGAALFSRSGSTILSQNIFYNSSDTGTYINNGFATLYNQISGQHQWFNAASGTAGNTASLTQLMTLDASGRLLIGGTSTYDFNGQANLVVNGTAGLSTITIASANGGYLAFADGTTGTDRYAGTINYEHSSNKMLFGTNGILSRVCIDSDGNLGVGTTSPAAKLELYSTADANFGQKIYHVSTALGTNRFPQLEFSQTPTGQSYENKVILRQQNSSYGNYPSLAFITNAASAGENTRIFLDGYTGYVGIGATAPSTNLVIGGTAASGGASGSLGTFLSRGVTTNFYEAFDGTKSFIAGVDNTQGYAKVGTLSQHPVALVAGNGNGFLYLTTSSNVSIGTTDSFNIITLPAASNGQGISWANYANVFGEFSSGATYLSSNYYPTPGAAGYKTTITATYGAAGMSINGTGGAGNGGLIQFFVNSATAKTAGAAFTPTEVACFTPSGLGLGGATPSSGIGITFPASQSASSNANTLDDYEEGTWTPALYYQNATGVTRTYTTQDGGYTKIGNTVTIWCVLKGATSNSGSYANDNIGISGLPFLTGSVGDSFAFATVGQGGFTGSSSVGPVGAQLSGSVGVFLQLADVATGNLGNDLGSATAYTIYVSGTYRI